MDRSFIACRRRQRRAWCLKLHVSANAPVARSNDYSFTWCMAWDLVKVGSYAEHRPLQGSITTVFVHEHMLRTNLYITLDTTFERKYPGQPRSEVCVKGVHACNMTVTNLSPPKMGQQALEHLTSTGSLDFLVNCQAVCQHTYTCAKAQQLHIHTVLDMELTCQMQDRRRTEVLYGVQSCCSAVNAEACVPGRYLWDCLERKGHQVYT